MSSISLIYFNPYLIQLIQYIYDFCFLYTIDDPFNLNWIEKKKRIEKFSNLPLKKNNFTSTNGYLNKIPKIPFLR